MYGLARRCAVVGHPVAHSLSPALHRAAYAALGLDWQFDAIDVPPGRLPGFVAGLDETWRGLAVTMPHKADAVTIGQPDQTVRRLGVANTIVLVPDGVQVHNTDVAGFVTALEYRRLNDVTEAILLGAGATARAALMALASLGVLKVGVQVRDAQRAGSLLTLADELGVDCAVEPLGTQHATDLLLSTLPSDAASQWTSLVSCAQVVFDVSYDPWPTPLADAAISAGRPLVTGLDLLCGQAVYQIDLMTGNTVDFETLFSAGHAELQRRQLRSLS